MVCTVFTKLLMIHTCLLPQYSQYQDNLEVETVKLDLYEELFNIHDQESRLFSFGERPKNSQLDSPMILKYICTCFLLKFPQELIQSGFNQMLFSFHLVLIDLFPLCINTVFCVLKNHYSTGLFVSDSSEKPNCMK
jgi:hypothetical protein